MPPLLMPQPALAPLVPPVHVVDLMTEAGSAAFDAQWRAREAKIVECPALSDAMPEFTTTYDIEPHAEERGYNDSDWKVVPATELGARLGGGMVSFFWYRATLTVPVNAVGFDAAGAMTVKCREWLAAQAHTRSRASTCRTGWCSPTRPPRATSSRLRCSRSTARFRPQPQISYGSARQRSSFSGERAPTTLWATRLFITAAIRGFPPRF
jgi:hypothetical protein